MVDEHSSNIRTQFDKNISPNVSTDPELYSDKVQESVEYLSVIKSTGPDNFPQLTIVMSDKPVDEVDKGVKKSVVAKSSSIESRRSASLSNNSTSDPRPDYDDQKPMDQSIPIKCDKNEDSRDVQIDCQDSGNKINNSDEQCSPVENVGSDRMSESPKPSTSQQGEKGTNS